MTCSENEKDAPSVFERTPLQTVHIGSPRRVPGSREVTSASMTLRAVLLLLCVSAAAAPAAGQTAAGQVVRPNAVLHSVADLDRSVAFYRDAVGLTLDPSPGVPGSTKAAAPRIATLSIPGADIHLTLIQFSGSDARPIRQRLQDPGGVKLVVRFRDLDAAFERVRGRLQRVYTDGGAPIRPEGPAAVNRSVIVRDPDGFPLEMVVQGTPPIPEAVPAASNVVGAWATFIVDDIRTSIEFYRTVMGFPPFSTPTAVSPTVLNLQGLPTATGTMSAGAKPPGAALLTWRMYDFRNVDKARLTGRLRDPGSTAVSFVVDNVAAFLARAKAAGAVIDAEPPAFNDGLTHGFIRDPNGLLIELVEAGATGG